MLNDISRFTRLSTLFQILPIGFVLGLALVPAWVGLDGFVPIALVTVILAAVALIGWGTAYLTFLLRTDRRVLDGLQTATEEICSGAVAPGTSVPARVVRTRRNKRHRLTAVLGLTQGLVQAQTVAVMTVLPPGAPARRVGVLAPADASSALSKASTHAVALHPTQVEAGVLDARVTGPQRDALAADPRWRTEPLPTDRTVVGGYLPLVGMALIGMVVGVGITLAVAGIVSAVTG